jgi:ABC-2 type transport system permease protein
MMTDTATPASPASAVPAASAAVAVAAEPTTRRSIHGAIHTLRVGWLRGVLEIKEFSRGIEGLIFTLALPIILLFVFGAIFSYKIDGTNTPFAEYFVPGILASSLIGVSFQTLAIQIALERDRGMLKRLRGTPMPPASYFFGKIIMVLALVIVESLLLFVVASALGRVHLPTDAAHWLTWIWVTLLGTAAGSMLGIWFSSVPRSGKAAPAVITPIALVLQFFSGVYFVFTQGSQTLQVFGALFPLKWIAQGYRSALLPDNLKVLEVKHQWEHGRIALVLAAWVIVGLALALTTFRWRSKYDK